MKIRGLLLAFLMSTIMGCSGGSGGSGGGYRELVLAPAGGVVNVKGKPVENPVVTFYPEVGASGVGVGNAKGEFTVKTNGQNGAPVGKCKVTVTAGSGGAVIPPSDGNEMKLLKKVRLNAKYANTDSTDLFVEISKEGNTKLVLDLDE